MNLLRSKSTVSLFLLGALATGGTLTANTLLTAKPAVALQWCWCTDYVAKHFGLPNNYGNAGTWGDGYLRNNGFSQVGSPQIGAVVVMKPSFSPNRENAGHVGIIESIRPGGLLTVRGANQRYDASYGYSVNDPNCNNVSVVKFGTSVTGRSDVTFWVKGNNPPSPQPPGGFHSVNFSAWVMSTTGANLRNSPHLADRSNQNVAYRQTLAFDGWTYSDVVNDLQLGTPDARWYKIAGQNLWVPSAYVNGNAPNSRPMP